MMEIVFQCYDYEMNVFDFFTLLLLLLLLFLLERAAGEISQKKCS
jgi:hypothetical protein